MYGEKTMVRAMETEDLRNVWRWENDLSVMKHMWIDPTSFRAVENYFEENLKDPKTKWFIIAEKESDLAIGVVWYYSLHPADRCEVGIYVGEEQYRGRGYGSDALKVFLEFLFGTKGLHRVGLSVAEDNPRAIRAYEKCGFREEGRLREHCIKDGTRVDLVNMGILKREFYEDRQGQNQVRS